MKYPPMTNLQFSTIESSKPPLVRSSSNYIFPSTKLKLYLKICLVWFNKEEAEIFLWRRGKEREFNIDKE